MSNSIQTLMDSIKRIGIQSVYLYTCRIIDSSGKNNMNFDTHLIDITLPGPKYQFYNNTFWRGNWEYRQPAGIKFEDNLVMTCIVPTVTRGTSNNILAFLQKYKQDFSYPGNGDSFYWKGPSNSNVTGYNLAIYPLDHKGNEGSPYVYTNCFVERVLPFKFSTEAEPSYQTMSIAWTVGAELNRL